MSSTTAFREAAPGQYVLPIPMDVEPRSPARRQMYREAEGIPGLMQACMRAEAEGPMARIVNRDGETKWYVRSVEDQYQEGIPGEKRIAYSEITPDAYAQMQADSRDLGTVLNTLSTRGDGCVMLTRRVGGAIDGSSIDKPAVQLFHPDGNVQYRYFEHGELIRVPEPELGAEATNEAPPLGMRG